jgi:hypothetical protein
MQGSSLNNDTTITRAHFLDSEFVEDHGVAPDHRHV